MEYNTTRAQLTIAEYGRNIQEMIQYACTIEDKEKRTKAAKFIVNVMGQMHPQAKETVDYKHKLWDHLYLISEFKIDVEAPYPPPSPLTLSEKPEHLSYRDKDIEFKHYGKNISLIIDKATQYEDGPEKEALTRAIAIHLKKSYLNWNRESVTDDLIEEHLRLLSKGKLQFHEDINLTPTVDLLARNKPRKPFRPKNTGNNNNNNMSQQRGRKKQ
jgi:hypothetical protein